MTLLCAPVNHLRKTDKVDLLELDKKIYKDQKPWPYEIVDVHNFEETPDLEALLKTMPRAHFRKIATMARSTLDSLRMLEFLQGKENIIGICMGELGQITRILAPVLGVPLMYALLKEEEKTAPGQLLVSELCEIYHFRKLNRATRIYGLIGYPVKRSISHLFHNEMFRKSGRNAVYVKMVVKEGELAEFFDRVKRLPFDGFSVTAPLKEAVMPFCDVIDPKAQKVGAVNTLVLKEGKVLGYNTDILGCPDVKNQRVVVLGAGGAAKAVIYAALEQKAHVTVVNRTLSKAREVSAHFGCNWSEQITPYDILINASSGPVSPDLIVPGTTVMDLTYHETQFLQVARQKGCHCIDGFTYYFQQAIGQQTAWTPTSIPPSFLPSATAP
jgi:3-dehydroquinate dehydratase/shikimate dehydrogenase